MLFFYLLIPLALLAALIGLPLWAIYRLGAWMHRSGYSKIKTGTVIGVMLFLIGLFGLKTYNLFVEYSDLLRH